MSAKTPSSPQLGFAFEAAAEERENAPPSLRRRVRRTWLVHELVTEARELVESEFGDVWVEGEISNLRPASSGHLYFTLKDAEAQLPVVLFRRQAMLLRFRPEDGLHVRVRGKASVYEQRGQLQLVGETMEPVGAGSLQLAFERLRERLKVEGLFEQERKRALPSFPRLVAIVTSPTGAVIRDFLNIVGRRHAGLNVVLVPAAVQGESAAAEIVAAIERANDLESADVIVLARGGGSLEDLAAFNSESVARAIAASRLAMVSAVGHETDFTIADFVADLRAPTPSAAAELITEAQHRVEELVAALENRLVRAARFAMMQSRQRLNGASVERAGQRVFALLRRQEQRLDDLGFRLESTMRQDLRQKSTAVAAFRVAVLRHDPRGRIGKASEELAAKRSRLVHALAARLAAERHTREGLEARLYRAARAAVAERRGAWLVASGRLNSLSPLAVLQRGYALVQDESGAVVRSVAQVAPEQTIQTRMSDGLFTSQVSTVMIETDSIKTGAIETRSTGTKKEKKNKR